MILDLGIARLEVPNADLLIPTAVLGIGKEDEQEKLGVGPTMAKTQLHKFRRTISVAFNQVKEGANPQTEIDKNLAEVAARMGAKVRSSENRAVQGAPAKIAELSYSGPKEVPLVTLALIVCSKGFLQAILLTGLDDRKVLKDLRVQFEKIASSVRPGSYFD